MSLGSVTPILRMFDADRTRDFYVGFLGFKIDWEHRFEDGLPLYMQVSKDGCVLHLTQHHGDCCPGSAIRIATTDIDAFQRTLLAKNYMYSRPGPTDAPGEDREMTIHDPSGNRLTFCSVAAA